MPESKSTRERPSKTAELVAAARARHIQITSPPVFEDRLAHTMCGPFWRTVLSSRLLSTLVIDGLLRNVKPVVPVILTRARFGEDSAETAVDAGLEQYVIVGAGYETFAMRRTDLMNRLTVYELDQAATQEAKLRRMSEAGIKEPEGVRYVQCDLNVETLQDALGRAGFDEGRPAMFSWFGVTYYLELDTIRKTLSDIAANMAPGSTVMFDYLADLDTVPDGSKQLHRRCANFVARRGEPWLSSFNPPELPGILNELGYSDIENLEPGMVGDRYWSSGTGEDYPPIMGLCRATTAAGSS